MNTYYIGNFPVTDELYHHGIKGQKWGIRRYQNPDGSLTPAGIARYGTIENFNAAQKKKNSNDSKPNSSNPSRVKEFVSKHKKGLAIAGGLLAAGAAAVVISKVAGSSSVSKGANAVKDLLVDKDGYNPKGTVFFAETKNGPIRGYYSPEQADFLRKMNGGLLPGFKDAKNYTSMTKEMADFTKWNKWKG